MAIHPYSAEVLEDFSWRRQNILYFIKTARELNQKH